MTEPHRQWTSRRRITRDDILAERNEILREPAGPERSRKLKRIRSRLNNLANRSAHIGDTANG